MDADRNNRGEDARRMAVLINDQRSLCIELESLSRAQATLIEGGDTDGVLEVLGKRQRIVDRMTHLNGDLTPLRENREELLGALDEASRRHVRECIDEINDLVERVRARDEEDRRTMEQRRAAIAGEIAGVTKARGAVAAYGAPRGTYGPRFQDRQG